MTELHQKFLLLRPMRTGVSGFARMQWERGQAWVQLNVRGAPGEGVRAFWYSSGGEARELGTCAANARGEASLEGPAPGGLYAPERLQALIVVKTTSRPGPCSSACAPRPAPGACWTRKTPVCPCATSWHGRRSNAVSRSNRNRRTLPSSARKHWRVARQQPPKRRFSRLMRPPSPCPPQPQRGKNPFRGKFFSQRWTLRPTCRPWSGL